MSTVAYKSDLYWYTLVCKVIIKADGTNKFPWDYILYTFGLERVVTEEAGQGQKDAN